MSVMNIVKSVKVLLIVVCIFYTMIARFCFSREKKGENCNLCGHPPTYYQSSSISTFGKVMKDKGYNI
jgi:hypothetical protein